MTEKIIKKYPFKSNTIYCGDNLDILKQFPDNSVDLIYIDPPFFTNVYYEIIWKDGYEVRAFNDKWRNSKKGGKEKGGLQNYLKCMAPVIRELHRVLKFTGSFYLHCDYHANAHLRILCDPIFGINNFQNEIIWYYTAGARGKKRWARKHDTILFYTKGKKWTFNWEAVAEPFTSKMTEWRYTKGGQKGKPMPVGKVPTDVFQIQVLNTMSKERLGYPTQKPEKLLEKIIIASSNPEDLVLDAFCGCGTTIAVAKKLGRRWIGIDISPTACKEMAKRISDEREFYPIKKIIGYPYTIEELRKMEPFEFQNWVVNKMQGIGYKGKTADGGIDGIIPLEGNIPIQVKRSGGVGINTVKNFVASIMKIKKKKGYIVGFSFTKGCVEEVAWWKNNKGIDIILKKVEDLINKKEVKKIE